MITVENEEDKNQYEVQINNELFTKINIDCICYFLNFTKISKNKFKSNYFSNIKYEQKTFITLNFVDDLQYKYYNSIKCGKITRVIDQNNITLEIDKHSNRNIEIKTIIFEKKDKRNNIIERAKLLFEANVGKKK